MTTLFACDLIQSIVWLLAIGLAGFKEDFIPVTVPDSAMPLCHALGAMHFFRYACGSLVEIELIS